MSQMKPLVSKKGSQEVTVEKRDGCVVIRSREVKTHRSFSVTVFDELLPGLISRLVVAARPASSNTEMKRSGKGRERPIKLSVPKID